MASFPNKMFGDYGEEKTVTTVKHHHLGTRMELPDGRTYAYARACATPLVAGYLYEGPNYAGTADLELLDILVTTTTAVGATTVIVTLGATTAIALSDYDDGYVYTASSASAGVGEVYKIKTASTAAAGATTTIILEENDKLNTAIAGGTTLAGIRPNEFDMLHLCPATTVRYAQAAGIPPVAVAGNSYCWVQRRGVATSFTATTVGIIGLPVAAHTGAAGEVGVFVAAASTLAASWPMEDPIGYSMNPAGTAANFSLIYLTLD